MSPRAKDLDLDEEELRAIYHALGRPEEPLPATTFYYRNRYVTAANDPNVERRRKSGAWRVAREGSELDGGGAALVVTEAGHRALWAWIERLGAMEKKKGWEVRERWNVTPPLTIFAPTRGRARSRALQKLRGLGIFTSYLALRAIRRPDLDVVTVRTSMIVDSAKRRPR